MFAFETIPLLSHTEVTAFNSFPSEAQVAAASKTRINLMFHSLAASQSRCYSLNLLRTLLGEGFVAHFVGWLSLTPDSRCKMWDLLSCGCEAPVVSLMTRVRPRGCEAAAHWLQEKGADWPGRLWRCGRILYMSAEEIVYQWSSKRGGRLRRRRRERFLVEAFERERESLLWLGSLLLSTEFQRWPIQ